MVIAAMKFWHKDLNWFASIDTVDDEQRVIVLLIGLDHQIELLLVSQIDMGSH